RRTSGERTGGGAHVGTYHLSVGTSAAAQIWAQAPSARGAHLLLRRRLPDRKLSAPPRSGFRRAFRREFLSFRYKSLRLFRSRGGLRRLPGPRFHGRQDALLRDLLHLRLALSDLRLPRHRSRAERRRRLRVL